MVLLLAAMPVQVWAFDAAAVQSCAKLKSTTKRLQCYDSAVGRHGVRPKGPLPGPSESPPRSTAAFVGQPRVEPPAVGRLERRWLVVPKNGQEPFLLTYYKPVYALPASYNTRPNQNPSGARDKAHFSHLEIKFQFSFKARLWPNLLLNGGDLWFGYTQLSFWQAYKASSPFRETNYEPELIYSLRTHFNLFGLHGRVLTLSLDHQSNGRSGALSRSWNRIIGGALFDNGDLSFQLRAWWRIPEPTGSDDNPDIEDYVGRGEFWGFYRHNEQTFGLMLRSNLDPEHVRGAMQFNWVVPLGGPLKGYLQWFYGYGESLIDYNHVNDRLSLGLMLVDWL
ncbi:MAG TPA: phospholipase A [Nitrococcus sp.]|nr:phospholipase A [Nitrococcus sp.]